MSIKTIRKLSQQSQRQKESLLGRVIKRLKITSTLRKGTDVNKGFDPFTISWEDESKALDEFSLFIKKELYPVLGPLFKVGELAAYKDDTILDVLMYMASNRVASENGVHAFREEYNRGGPSARTIRYRLEKLELLEVEYAFLRANRIILSFFTNQKKNRRILSFFKNKKKKVKAPVVISLDKSYVPCYGERREGACGKKRERGTNYGYGYASCVVSVAGIRVILHTVALTKFTSNEDILEELITEARKYVEIEVVLLDREFSNSPCITKLEELTVKYLTPVVEHRREFLQSLRPPCKAVMPLGSMHVPVVAVKDPDHPEKTLYYVTNMDIPLDQLDKVIGMYRKRWTIENAFKSQKLVFLAKTYSVNFAIRFFFWMLATLLYNAWILCNFCAYTDLEKEPAQQKRPLITAFRFGNKMKTAFLSPLFSDGGPEELLLLAVAVVGQYFLKNFPSERVIPPYMMNN